jgi:hypothetical protein
MGKSASLGEEAVLADLGEADEIVAEVGWAKRAIVSGSYKKLVASWS